MRAFARLLDRLAFSPARTAKLRLIAAYLAETPDPDRGWAVAALTGDLDLRLVTPSLLRGLAAERVDPELFAYSYDFVGDLAETIALIWPDAGEVAELRLSAVVARLAGAGKAELPGLIAGWLDRLPAPERFALLKLATGGMRVGVSARLMRTALAEFGGKPLPEIEEIWHGLSPPYADLFAWFAGGPAPEQAARAPFRPVMLSTPVTPEDLGVYDPADYLAEWKWDGIRVQAVSDRGLRRLYSRTGDDISAAFPDVLAALGPDAVIDGELLVRRDGQVAPFGDLQKRLGRKSVGKAMLASHSAFLRAYDLMIDGGEDLRTLPLTDRRARLETLVATLDPARVDLSPLVPFAGWDDLAALRAAPPAPEIEGLMLKRRDSAYQPTFSK